MRNPYFSMCLCFMLLVSSYVSGKSALRFECYQGAEITPHQKDIVEMVNRIYREAPYYFSGEGSKEYDAYLESFAKTKDALVCLAYDGEKVVGMAQAMPLSKSKENYQKPLTEKGYELETLFYLGEFGLQPDYIGSGLRIQMLEKIEKFVRDSGKYKILCFWEVERDEKSNVLGYVPHEDFWIKHGFTKHPEIHFLVDWKNVAEQEKSPHKAVYWLKKL